MNGKKIRAYAELPSSEIKSMIQNAGVSFTGRTTDSIQETLSEIEALKEKLKGLSNLGDMDLRREAFNMQEAFHDAVSFSEWMRRDMADKMYGITQMDEEERAEALAAMQRILTQVVENYRADLENVIAMGGREVDRRFRHTRSNKKHLRMLKAALPKAETREATLKAKQKIGEEKGREKRSKEKATIMKQVRNPEKDPDSELVGTRLAWVQQGEKEWTIRVEGYGYSRYTASIKDGHTTRTKSFSEYDDAADFLIQKLYPEEAR